MNRVAQTNPNGYYSFDLLPGAYWLEQRQPFGYLSGQANVGSVGVAGFSGSGGHLGGSDRHAMLRRIGQNSGQRTSDDNGLI